MRHQLGPEDIELIKQIIGNTSDPDLLCSSRREFALWYRLNIAFLKFSTLVNQRISLKDIFKIFKVSLYDLLFRSNISFYPSDSNSKTTHILISWIINSTDSKEQIIARYFGPLSTNLKMGTSIIAVSGIKLSRADLLRLNAEGVSVIAPKSYSILEIIKTFAMIFSLKSKTLILDAEFLKGQKISQYISEYIKPMKILGLLMPYEQQPWQLALIRRLRIENPQMKLIGDAHTSLTNFPAQFLHTSMSPDTIIVHGLAYKSVLTKFCDWRSDQIEVVESLRTRKKYTLETSKLILPYTLTETENIGKWLKEIGSAVPEICQIEVQPHPVRIKDNDYRESYEKILKIVTHFNSNRVPGPKKVVIILGVTSVLLEYLESGFDAFCIFANPYTESWNSQIWECLRIESISSNISKMSLQNSNEFVIYPDEIRKQSDFPTLTSLRSSSYSYFFDIF